MRSAWIKWARAVELQQQLARATREYGARDTYDYVRTDNAVGHGAEDPLVRMHWKLRIKEPHPERWSILLGDILTNFRAALDHAFWYAANNHSGPPDKPNLVVFPIATTAKQFKRYRDDLSALVSPQVWEAIESIQPLHGEERAHTHPLAILQWLSNMDKHRFVHIVGLVSIDLGPTIVEATPPVEIVENWRLEGPAEDGAVVARLKFKRSPGNRQVDLKPTFGKLMALQICDDPLEIRSVSSLMPAMQSHVLTSLAAVAGQLGVSAPDLESLELGEEHKEFAAEFGGDRVNIHPLTGT